MSALRAMGYQLDVPQGTFYLWVRSPVADDEAFERFARPDSSRARSDGGAGLGLAIVSAIAEAHGGRARARNRPEGGAVVGLELPGAVAADEVIPTG